MTKETFEKAKNIITDIQSLKNIKSEYENRNWISFYGATVGEQLVTGRILRDDLEKFVVDEIAKLEKELEKL
jgi:hypothetical protein